MMIPLVVPDCMITAGACIGRYDELDVLSVTLDMNPVLAPLYSIISGAYKQSLNW